MKLTWRTCGRAVAVIVLTAISALFITCSDCRTCAAQPPPDLTAEQIESAHTAITSDHYRYSERSLACGALRNNGWDATRAIEALDLKYLGDGRSQGPDFYAREMITSIHGNAAGIVYSEEWVSEQLGIKPGEFWDEWPSVNIQLLASLEAERIEETIQVICDVIAPPTGSP